MWKNKPAKRKPGRPPTGKPPVRLVSVKLPEDLHKRLVLWCTKTERLPGQQLRVVLRAALDAAGVPELPALEEGA